MLLVAIADSALADELSSKPSVTLDYKIYIGGLEALSATAAIASESDHYDIEIKATTAGAIGKVMPWAVSGSRSIPIIETPAKPAARAGARRSRKGVACNVPAHSTRSEGPSGRALTALTRRW